MRRMGSVAAGVAVAMQAGAATSPAIRADAASAVYPCGAVASVGVSFAGGPSSGVAEAWADDGWTNVLWRATADLSKERTLRAELTRATPGTVRIHAKAPRMAEALDRVVFGLDDIKPLTPCPEGFDDYWRGEREHLDREVPLDARMERAPDLDTPDHELHRISFATFNGRRVYGFLALPRGAAAFARFPFVVNVPGAGPGLHTVEKRILRKGWGGVTLNLHCFPPGRDAASQKAAYGRWFEEYAKAKGEPRYQYVGYSESREAPIYHDAYLGMVRALDWLAQRPFADPGRIVYYGCSQGGGSGIYLAGLWGRFSKVLFLCPNKCDMLSYLKGRVPGTSHIFNQKPENRARAEEVAPWHDACNFARQISCPVRMVHGLSDDNCNPEGAIAAFNVMPSAEKKLILLPGRKHGWIPAGQDKWLFAP